MTMTSPPSLSTKKSRFNAKRTTYTWWDWKPSKAEVEAGYRDIRAAFEDCGMIKRKPNLRATKISSVGGHVKKVLMLVMALAWPLSSWAGKPLGAEAPFEICTDGFSVTVTSFSWTRVPSSQCAGRTGVFINALSGNTGTARCIGTATTTTPSVSTGTYAYWENPPSSNAMLLGASDKVYLWCLTTHTASEALSGVEVKQ